MSKSSSFRAAALHGLLLALPKSNQKARRLTRCSDSLRANRNPPVLLGDDGVRSTHIPVRSLTRAHRARAPAGNSAAACDARHRERRRDPLTRPSMGYVFYVGRVERMQNPTDRTACDRFRYPQPVLRASKPSCLSRALPPLSPLHLVSLSVRRCEVPSDKPRQAYLSRRA